MGHVKDLRSEIVEVIININLLVEPNETALFKLIQTGFTDKQIIEMYRDIGYLYNDEITYSDSKWVTDKQTVGFLTTGKW